MDMLTYVKQRLESARGTWGQVSRDSGVPYFTIAKIMQERTKNPRIQTVEKLNEYFRERDVPAS